MPDALAELLQSPASLSGIELAPWHEARPHIIVAALGKAHRLAPHLDRLARLVLTRAPRRVLAASTLRTAEASSNPRLLDHAILQTHIGIRTPTHAYAVAVDVDHDEWPDQLDQLVGHGLPRPTWIAADPWTGRAHLVWWLRDAVVVSEAGHPAPKRLLDAVSKILMAALCGDPAYTGQLTKSPWAPGTPLAHHGTPATRYFGKRIKPLRRTCGMR